MRWYRVSGVVLVLAGLLVALTGNPAGVAAAGSVEVGDDFACTRDGLAAAIDAVAGEDPDDPGLVTFDCADPVIEMTSVIRMPPSPGRDYAVEIDGSNGGDQIVLDGGGTSRIFSTDYNATLTLAHLTLRNGGADPGGAIFAVNGSITIISCSFIDNSSVVGGAIYIDGELQISGSLFSGNSSLESGGAIYVSEGDVLITGTTFYQNHAGDDGGAIYVSDDVTSIYASTFAENTADVAGSAVYVAVVDDTELRMYQTTVVQPEGEGTEALYFGSIELRGVILDGYGIHCRGGSTVSIKNSSSYSNSGDCGILTKLSLGLGPLTTMTVDGVQQYFYPLSETSEMVDLGLTGDCFPRNHPYGDVDQLGVSRPLGDACDIGAIERPADYELCVNRWTGAARMPVRGDCDRSEALLDGPVYPWPVLCVNQWNGSVRVGEPCGRSEWSLAVVGDGSIGLCANAWNGALRVSDRCSRSEREVWL